jgi:hypothetical protein
MSPANVAVVRTKVNKPAMQSCGSFFMGFLLKGKVIGRWGQQGKW